MGYLAHARELKPNDGSLAYEFGAICVRLNLLAEARKAMDEARKAEPDNPDFLLGLGTVVSWDHNPADAFPLLTRYLALKPKDVRGTYALGVAYFRAQDPDHAGPLFPQTIDDAGGGPSAAFYLAKIARQKHEYDAAVGYLNRSLAARREEPEAWAELGQIHVQMKDFKEAETELGNALKLDPDSYARNFGLLQLYTRTGDDRREQQAQRFAEVKEKAEKNASEMMRTIEVRRM